MADVGLQEMGVVLTAPEQEVTRTYYHQTAPENVEAIIQGGFAREKTAGGNNGVEGPIRGVFLKETPELLPEESGIGQTQLEVTINPQAKVLDITNEDTSTYAMSILNGVAVPKGDQNFALAGWLERNGHAELAEHYFEAIRRVFAYQNTERLDQFWPEVEKVLNELGYKGVKFMDKMDKGEKPFPATVMFDPADISIKK
ncbi:MAG: hypothetical protein G01um10145_122 [Microgenomates group bacterium Gr01-1014_5]|nr:MAG: hypothetical protein G01um10145_122 [Microgenomates group bacterium Gr01-1014_5]